MVGWVRRAAQPLVRLTTVQKIEHEAVFDAFAGIVQRAALEERVRREPRVISFRQKRGVL
ncbi:hypothetical protein [Acuticoccus sp. I52.16.1]|uniref:hypothetical protein n=1 Tax=Acuticoccus sp. I52.16.1 TaxID=2928472 RepID=UPI001FD1CD4E|nr:hypothetical protein [Acuticoccus sp. I52.16.1]UOM33825.1 hypothetical protein MRB58_18610 [Acuticoccus sp. I52.16.1]